MTTLWFEDVVIGQQERSGDHPVDRDEMVSYAQQNDPWPIHVDVDAGTASPFGDVIASFGYTVSLFFRAAHELPMNQQAGEAFLGAVGWDVAFRGAVRAGDVLHVEATIRDKRVTSKGDRGVVTTDMDVVNQHGATVVTIAVTSLLLCRPS